MSDQRVIRPYSLPPTNIEGRNDYMGIDRGLFLTRDSEPSYLRVVEAEWKSYGPANSPGILRFKLGLYPNKPETDEQFNAYTLLKSKGDDEWFDVATSGPTHFPVLVEYWAKFIYYNYYALKKEVDIQSIMEDNPLLEDVEGIGTAFTQSLVPSIDTVAVTALYSVSTGSPLGLTSMVVDVTPKEGTERTIGLPSETIMAKGFDPVVAVSKMM